MAIGIGDTLRSTRVEQGRTVEEASRATRIRADYLRALEEEHFDILGGDVYAKGFLQTYARWLGLDPQPLLALYRNNYQRGEYDAHALIQHPVARQPRESARTWLTWVGVTVVVLLVALAVAGALGGRSPEPATEPPPGTAAPATTPPVGVAGPGGTGQDPSPSPSPTAVNLVLVFEERSWVRVRIGGNTVLEGIIEAGETREFNAPVRMQVRVGNAGGLRLVLNGRDLGSPAGRGIAMTVTCTLDSCSEAT